MIAFLSLVISLTLICFTFQKVITCFREGSHILLLEMCIFRRVFCCRFLVRCFIFINLLSCNTLINPLRVFRYFIVSICLEL